MDGRQTGPDTDTSSTRSPVNINRKGHRPAGGCAARRRGRRRIWWRAFGLLCRLIRDESSTFAQREIFASTEVAWSGDDFDIWLNVRILSFRSN